jgi:hypothetical protein
MGYAMRFFLRKMFCHLFWQIFLLSKIINRYGYLNPPGSVSNINLSIEGW